jgi:hypothetical protein
MERVRFGDSVHLNTKLLGEWLFGRRRPRANRTTTLSSIRDRFLGG